MIKSPLRYPGGKSRAVKIISSLIPDYSEFREPFVGGGSVFIHQKQLHPNSKFWINDLYQPLYIFWKQAQKNMDSLIKKIHFFKNEFENGKELFQYLKTNYDSFDDLEKSAAFFIFNRITFSGTTDSGGYSEGAFKGRFTNSSIERLNQIKSLISDITITNIDYQQVVEEKGENVFIFLDPPYYSATKSALYGKNGDLHKGFDHIRFAETMRKCNHKWLITYDDSEYIRDLFSFAIIKKWNLMYGMRNITPDSDQKGRELFISNYEIELKTDKMPIQQKLFL